MMLFEDDRTEEFKSKPHIIILATDSFMSGWGGAGDGPSYAGWACDSCQEYQVERWVRSRSEMKRVRVVGSDYKPPSGPGHCHIYVVDDNHPSVK